MRLVALDGRVAFVTGSGQSVGRAKAAGLMHPLPSLPPAAVR